MTQLRGYIWIMTKKVETRFDLQAVLSQCSDDQKIRGLCSTPSTESVSLRVMWIKLYSTYYFNRFAWFRWCIGKPADFTGIEKFGKQISKSNLAITHWEYPIRLFWIISEIKKNHMIIDFEGHAKKDIYFMLTPT